MLALSKTRESVGRRDRAPESSTLVVLCWQGLTAPLAMPCHCILSHRAGGLGCHSSRHHRAASALGWPGAHHRAGWRGASGFPCTRYCVCWVPGGCSVMRCSCPTAMLVQEALGSIPQLSMFLWQETVGGHWNSALRPQEGRLELAPR